MLPRYGQIEANDDFLKEYIDIASKFKNNEFYDLIKKTTVGWVDKLSKNKKIEKYLKEKLDMMSINSPEFRDYRATAKYERALDEIKEKDEKIKELDEKIKELEKQIAKTEESNSP